jgi:hypothetical protein
MALSGGDALAILLPAESFLLAAVTVALATNAPDKGFVSFVRLPVLVIPIAALVVTAAVATGAVAAWAELYGHGAFGFNANDVIGASLLIAAVGQPALTAVLALAMVEG